VDGFIGLVVILPLLFFAGWILKKSAMLYLGRDWSKGWVGLFWISVVFGLGLGVWFSGYAEWDAMRFRRLPIPIEYKHPKDGWIPLEFPVYIRSLALGTDFVIGLMLAMFPIAAAMRIAEFMDESRRIKSVRTNQDNPSSDETP
tara:strand:- start:21 stop:452 length:432 start_codon:yes stop_codon:yes gene_type:complete